MAAVRTIVRINPATFLIAFTPLIAYFYYIEVAKQSGLAFDTHTEGL